MMRFVNIVFYATGVLTWYCLLVLGIARLLHGRVWPREDDVYDEFTEQRDAARWN